MTVAVYAEVAEIGYSTRMPSTRIFRTYDSFFLTVAKIVAVMSFSFQLLHSVCLPIVMYAVDVLPFLFALNLSTYIRCKITD